MPCLVPIFRFVQLSLVSCFFCFVINGQTFDLPVSDTVAEDTSRFLSLRYPESDGTKNFSLWNFTQPPQRKFDYKTNASSPILLYTPDLDFAGSDTFDWNGSELGVYSDLYQFTITVTDVPDPPIIYTAGSSVDSRTPNKVLPRMRPLLLRSQ